MKHGLLLTDDFFGFCADKVITKEGRFSLIDYLNKSNNDNHKFMEFNPPKVLEWMRDRALAEEVGKAKEVLDEYTDLYYWLTRGDIADPRYSSALQRAWMILKEMNKCEKCA